MNPSAKQLFPTWYKRAGYETDNETITARLAAIQLIIDIDDNTFWSDIITLFLGIPVQSDQVDAFLSYFLAEDAAFPVTDNENILRILSASALAILFDNVEGAPIAKIALAIKTRVFLGQYAINDFMYVLTYAKLNLYEHAAAIRSYDLTKVADDLDVLDVAFGGEDDDSEIVEINKSEIRSILDVARNLVTVNKSMKEEVNIHWWLFGQYSLEFKSDFAAISLKRMVYTAAFELFKLTGFDAPLFNSLQYLRKALSLVKEDKSAAISIYDTISSLGIDDKNKILNGLQDKADAFTPLLLAIKCSTQVGDDDWSIHFKGMANNAIIKKNAAPLVIAEQLYLELILLNLE